jgi:hypothetical protein
MKRHMMTMLLLVAAVGTAATHTRALAADGDAMAGGANKGGLGFRTSDAPIGMRWWFTDMIGLDAGVGFTSEKVNYLDQNSVPADESFNTFSVDVGVPIALKSWDKSKFVFRPGVLWTQLDDIDTFLAEAAFTTPTKEKITDYSVTGELELEWFVAENASISASHGFGFRSVKRESDDKANTIFGTFASNLTTLGFHVYLWK